MALSRPTLSALYARTKADFVALSETGGAILTRSVEYVLSRITARVAHGMYAYLDDRALQSFPDTADEAGVRKWGALFGVTQNPATASTGDVVFTGTNTTAIPAGTEIRIGDQTYTTDALGTISSGTATIAVTASTVGAAGDQPAAATGSLTNPIAGIDTEVTVDSGGLTGGTDVEALETYRTRVLTRMSSPPRGGSVADYTAWISETPTVSVFKSWVTAAGDGVGTVTAAFVVSSSSTGTGFDLATSPQVTAVQTYVDAEKPADVRSFRAYTPTGTTLSLTIDLTLEAGADLGTVQAAIVAALKTMLGTDAIPETAIPLSRISEVISTTAGEASHVIDSPGTDPTPGVGAIFDDVSITWS